MKRILTVAAVFAALLVMSCGTSTEDKNKIEDQAKRITTLEQTVSDLQKTVNEQKAKAATPQTPTPAPAPVSNPTPTQAPGGATKNPGTTK